MKKTMLVVFLLLLAGLAEAKSYYFPQVELNYELEDDASVFVKEKLTFNFEGDFHYAYRDFPYGGWEYSSIKVFEVRNGAEIPIEAEDLQVYEDVGFKRVKWFYSAYNERKTFLLTYVLKKAIVSYEDAYEFYWKAWGNQWDARAESLDARVTFPKKLYSGSRVWLHPLLDARYELEGDVLTIHANNIPPKTFLELRVLFNKETLNGSEARVVGGKGYDKVVSEENMNSFIYGTIAWLWLYPVMVFVILAGGFYYYYNKYGRELHKTPLVREHDIPYGDKPWEVEWILTQNTSVKSMTATLLDLARRGHLKIEKTTPTGFVFKKDDYLLTRAQGRDELHPFEEWLLDEVFQKKIGGWFSTHVEPGDSIKVSEIAQAHKSDTQSMADKWRMMTKMEIGGADPTAAKRVGDLLGKKTINLGGIKPIVAKSDEANAGGIEERYLDKTGRVYFNRLQMGLVLLTLVIQLLLFSLSIYSLGAMLLIAGFLLLSYRSWLGRLPSSGDWLFSPGSVLIALIAAGFVLVFSGNLNIWMIAALAANAVFVLIDGIMKFALTKFTPEGEERHNRWAGLKWFLDTMDNMREKIPTDVVLWEQYLVYATVFGNAKKVAKQMEVLNIQPPRDSGFAAVAASGSFASFASSFSSGFSAASAASASGGAGGGGGGGAG
ncbi:DUF2207 domain-containing protein [Candidatus Micrarchaeota archaeon]|nr:DUF2207 domain-containing protein [Candidatus Micrarchaeota archaeon]